MDEASDSTHSCLKCSSASLASSSPWVFRSAANASEDIVLYGVCWNTDRSKLIFLLKVMSVNDEKAAATGQGQDSTTQL